MKDLNRMKFEGAVDPDSPLGLRRGIKLGTESYHNLFKRLCRYPVHGQQGLFLKAKCDIGTWDIVI